MEKMTTAAINAYLLDYVVTWAEPQGDDVDRWAWDLSEAVDAGQRFDADGAALARACSHEFATQLDCQNYAVAWLWDNRPELVSAAKRTVEEGIRRRTKGLA